MSNYIPPRRIRLRLKALTEAVTRLSISNETLSLNNAELVCSQERVKTLGESISRHLVSYNLNPVIPDSQDSVSSLTGSNHARAIALYKALNEKEHSILGALVLPELLPEEKDLLEQGESRVPGGKSHLSNDAILDKLTEAVRNAHNRIAGVERGILTEKTQSCLEALGYDVRIKSKNSGVLVRGIKQDLSIAACIDKSGNLSIDMAGFEGGACKKALELLIGRLSESGIIMEDLKSIHHGKKEGGVLAQEAASKIPFVFNPLKNNNQRHLLALSRQRTMIKR